MYAHPIAAALHDFTGIKIYAGDRCHNISTSSDPSTAHGTANECTARSYARVCPACGTTYLWTACCT